MHHVFEERDLLARTAKDETEPSKLVPSLNELWEEESRRRMRAGLPPTIPPPKSVEGGRVLPEGEHPKWQAGDRLWQFIEARLQEEQKSFEKRPPSRAKFTKTHALDQHIVTLFESVDLFHPRSSIAATQADPSNPYSSQMAGLTQVAPASERETERPDPREARSRSPVLFGNEHEPTSDSSLPRTRSSGAPAAEDAPPGAGVWDISASMDEVFHHSQVDQDFFQSQAFQKQVQDAEESYLQEEVGEAEADEGEGENGPAGEGSTTPQVSPGKKTPSRSRPGTPSRRQDVQPSTPSRGPDRAAASSFVTPSKRPAHSAVRSSPLSKKSTSTFSSRPFKLAKTGSQSSPTRLGSKSRKSRVTFADSPSIEMASSTQPAPTPASISYQFAFLAPTREDVMDSFAEFNLPREDHQAPYYSLPEDVPDRPREYAGRSFTFKSITLPYLSEFTFRTRDSPPAKQKDDATGRIHAWEFSRSCPSRDEVTSWLAAERASAADVRKRRRKRLASQIERMTQQQDSDSYGFKTSQLKGSTRIEREKQHMSTLAIETFACSRKDLLPDPEQDRIEAIAYSFQNEDENLEDTGSRSGLRTGVLVVAREGVDARKLGLACELHVVESEELIFAALIALVRRFDPEVLVGYEIHNGSWGYVIDRARSFDLDMVLELGRVREGSTGAAKGKADSWGYTQTSALRITGRHILNIWRLMRGEVALTQYTYENIVYHLLHRRVAKFSPATLTEWYRSTRVPELVARVLRYFVAHAEGDLEIIDSSELVFRTAEFARIYGVDFFSVLSRGSQFKVESVMFRIAKPESFALPSPNAAQVASQNAAECIPLIMEPQSAFFKGPLVVVDFQSLYPSVMIGYNICYSTCLGRVSDFKGVQKFGFSELTLPKGLLTLLKDDISISPNGLVYVKPHIRRSTLAKMLSEILDTRVMVKGSMKGVKDDRAFLRQQNARQLSLKLLANVTYGYTSASFSGRMPCVEIADSIVQYGRETLERSIQLIEAEEKWGAKVVYGDTDSLFIYLEGRTKEDAFKIGNDIANTVTAHNPKPVKLKFEKVYLPCVLLAKKRYVGYKFEHPEDEIPVFEAKGIETVRRDGNAALQRIQEACLRILFRTRDLSQVKGFLQRQWRKILEGRINVQDFIIAKEVRLGSYSETGVPPPGAAVATRKMLRDPRAEPQHAERVPYVITQGEPKAKLNDQAVPPEQMLENPWVEVSCGRRPLSLTLSHFQVSPPECALLH